MKEFGQFLIGFKSLQKNELRKRNVKKVNSSKVVTRINKN